MDTRRLKESAPSAALKLCQRLNEAGYRGWLVGGAVRDILLDGLREATGVSTTRNDWDIATDAHPEQVMSLFRRVIPTGIQHGTVTVMLQGEGFEVTTLRGEGQYSDGRRPDSVHFVGAIEDDLARRDFTINAIAYEPLEDRLIDPFGGIQDLSRGVLRAVGEPRERFEEDGLRVLRAARFAATLQVELDAETLAAIRPSLASYRRVSAERIRDEWFKALRAPRPSVAFRIMQEHGMLAITAPELEAMVGCEQNRFHAFDVWEHTLACVDGCPPRPKLRLAALLHDVGKPRSRAFDEGKQDYTFFQHEQIGAPMARALVSRLRCSREVQLYVEALVRHHLVVYDASWSDSAVRRWIRRVTPELLDDVLELNRADVVAKGRGYEADLERLCLLRERVEVVLRAGNALSVGALALRGDELMRELKLSPGPVVGEALRALLEYVIDDPERNERAKLIEQARRWLAERKES